jgi:hypothetical protein
MTNSPYAASRESRNGTRPPDVHGVLTGASRVETCRVPSVFLDLLFSGVLAPSRRLAGDR